jgi:hypothetical protein
MGVVRGEYQLRVVRVGSRVIEQANNLLRN